jgi:hypothetical protein
LVKTPIATVTERPARGPVGWDFSAAGTVLGASRDLVDAIGTPRARLAA